MGTLRRGDALRDLPGPRRAGPGRAVLRRHSRVGTGGRPAPTDLAGDLGSDRRIAATAPLADGWLASAYNATPDQYAAARTRLDGHLRSNGREPSTFPDAVATAWLHVTESRAEAEHVIDGVLAPTLGRDPAALRHLPIGSPEHCARALAAYSAAGAREVLLWPLRDPIVQLQRIAAGAPTYLRTSTATHPVGE